jgi:hypothetical protein
MSTDVIDLCSDSEEPPAAPQRGGQARNNNETVIDLLSDQEEESAPTSSAPVTNNENIRPRPNQSIRSTPPPTTTSPKNKGTLFDYFSVRLNNGKLVKNPYKRVPKGTALNQPNAKKSKADIKEEGAPSKLFEPFEDVAIVEPTPAEVKKLVDAGEDKAAAATATKEDDEDECMIVGQKGDNALSDFPHSREDCVVHPMVYNKFQREESIATAAKHCPNCYCFVCDILASTCQHWNEHCKAKFKDYFWKCERSRKRREGDAYMPRQDPSHRTIVRRNNMTAPVVRPPPARTVTPASVSRNNSAAVAVLSRQTLALPAAPRQPVPSHRARATSPTFRPVVPTVPVVSPWINTEVRLIGIDMTDEERTQYEARIRMRQSHLSIRNLYKNFEAYGAAPAALEANVTGPLSVYGLTFAWTIDKLQRDSSKIRGLVKDLIEARNSVPHLVAVVFCQNPAWRNAIARALQKETFMVVGHVTVPISTLPGAVGLVRVLSTFPAPAQSPYSPAKDATVPPCARVYFLEQYINMAWESIALGSIARGPSGAGPPLQVRKMLLKNTAEENVVNFQNALISGAAKMQTNSTEIDKAGVAILLKGLLMM